MTKLQKGRITSEKLRFADYCFYTYSFVLNKTVLSLIKDSAQKALHPRGKNFLWKEGRLPTWSGCDYSRGKKDVRCFCESKSNYQVVRTVTYSLNCLSCRAQVLDNVVIFQSLKNLVKHVLIKFCLDIETCDFGYIYLLSLKRR